MSKDPLLLNKLFGAVLVAAWAIVGSILLGSLLYPSKEAGVERAYPIAGAEQPAAPADAAPTEQVPAEQAAEAPAEQAAEAPAEQAADAPAPADPATLLAAADADAGAKVARKCSACHSFDKGGPNKVGPALWDVVGRDVGKHEGYSYSPAMAGHGGAWDYESLNGFLTAPKAYVEGTKMGFAGIAKDGDRADLLAYLRTLSDNPKPLP